jgi:hypothetical protein
MALAGQVGQVVRLYLVQFQEQVAAVLVDIQVLAVLVEMQELLELLVLVVALVVVAGILEVEVQTALQVEAQEYLEKPQVVLVVLPE